jgi:hypothetical protein
MFILQCHSLTEIPYMAKSKGNAILTIQLRNSFLFPIFGQFPATAFITTPYQEELS